MESNWRIITREQPMAIKNTAKRHAPIPPGEMLRDALDRVGLSANAAASKMKIPGNRLTAILKGQRSITADTAMRLARLLGGTAAMWLRMQTLYDLEEAEEKSAAQINREVAPLAQAS
jgi:antitoxin HigA-1